MQKLFQLHVYLIEIFHLILFPSNSLCVGLVQITMEREIEQKIIWQLSRRKTTSQAAFSIS